MPSGASLGNPGMLQGLMNNFMPSGGSGLENSLKMGALGQMLGGLLGGGDKPQMGASPLPPGGGGGGGYRPSVSGQLEALQQLALASRKPKQGGFF